MTLFGSTMHKMEQSRLKVER